MPIPHTTATHVVHRDGTRTPRCARTLASGSRCSRPARVVDLCHSHARLAIPRRHYAAILAHADGVRLGCHTEALRRDTGQRWTLDDVQAQAADHQSRGGLAYVVEVLDVLRPAMRPSPLTSGADSRRANS